MLHRELAAKYAICSTGTVLEVGEMRKELES